MATCLSVTYHGRYIIVSKQPRREIWTCIYIFSFKLCFSCLHFKIGKKEVSQGILAKKSLYENNNQMDEKSGVKKSTTSKTTKENGLIEKKEVVVETKDAETKKADVKNTVESRNRKESQSYGKQCYRITPPNYEYYLFYFIIIWKEKWLFFFAAAMLEGEEGEKEGEGEGHVGGQERTKHFSPPGT